MVMVSCHVPDPAHDARTRPVLSQNDLHDGPPAFKGINPNPHQTAQAHQAPIVWRDVTSSYHGLSSSRRTMPVMPGDQLRIIVYREKDLSNLFVVSERGTITYPLLGEIDVNGLTPSQIANKIRENLRGDYLVAPHVMADRVEFCADQLSMPDQSLSAGADASQDHRT